MTPVEIKVGNFLHTAEFEDFCDTETVVSENLMFYTQFSEMKYLFKSHQHIGDSKNYCNRTAIVLLEEKHEWKSL